jgi:hypothetical protein
MPYSKLVFPVSVTVLIFLVLLSTTDNDIVAGEDIEFMNGVSLVAPPKKFDENPFNSIEKINADWVAIMPYAFTDTKSPEVIFDSPKQWWGERSEGIKSTIEYARQSGMKILLKPHVWVQGQGWAGDFRLGNDTDWETWEDSYMEYIMHYASLAESAKVEAFCIGLELKYVVKERAAFWNVLIAQVRKVYSGKITYAANWDNFQVIPFWDKLDFIGINAYFPLSQEDQPTSSELYDAWEEHKIALRKLSEMHKKGIVLTEYGYRSIDKAAGNQWELEHHRKHNGKSNYEIQKEAYLALYKSLWDEPWIRGGFLWKWYPNEIEMTHSHNSDYTPQGKPTEKVIKDWYKKR